MLSILTTVWLLHLVATMTPGTNTLLVTQLAASNCGSAAGFAAVGVALGSALWALLAVAGVNLIFTAFPVLRISLQVAGALYLLYLATRLWSSGGISATAAAESVAPVAAMRLGLLTNFTNPKAALFFGSVFSACFPADPSAALLAAAVGVVFVNALCWYGLLAHLFSREPVRLAYLRQRRMAGKVAGVVLGALGLRFLLLSLREVR